jgi:hypothetical protein
MNTLSDQPGRFECSLPVPAEITSRFPAIPFLIVLNQCFAVGIMEKRSDELAFGEF